MWTTGLVRRVNEIQSRISSNFHSWKLLYPILLWNDWLALFRQPYYRWSQSRICCVCSWFCVIHRLDHNHIQSSLCKDFYKLIWFEVLRWKIPKVWVVILYNLIKYFVLPSRFGNSCLNSCQWSYSTGLLLYWTTGACANWAIIIKDHL